jgi:hypothetical protein
MTYLNEVSRVTDFPPIFFAFFWELRVLKTISNFIAQPNVKNVFFLYNFPQCIQSQFLKVENKFILKILR